MWFRLYNMQNPSLNFVPYTLAKCFNVLMISNAMLHLIQNSLVGYTSQNYNSLWCMKFGHWTEAACNICNKSGSLKQPMEAHVCIQVSMLPQDSPACRLLTACRPWGASERHCNPPRALFFGRIKAWKIHKLLNAESVPHWAWAPQLPHYTLSAPPPLFYSTLPPV